MIELRNELANIVSSSPSELSDAQAKALKELLRNLNNGYVRAAEQISGQWVVNQWVKQGILLLYRYNKMVEMSSGVFEFFDKLPLKSIYLDDNIRIPPGGSSVRTGAYVARGVVCMPPMYINIGAYVDEETMIDSHALVGTCAQIGKRVHISAATQIGGVLEPIGASPVIIEDDVMVGGNCGIYEGVIVQRNAVIGTGVILNASVKVYDLVNETVLVSSANSPLVIPENAVVIQGSRQVNSEYGKANGLSISTPLIVKYRDAKTDAKTELETVLRDT
ncbi:MAG: 2,3,4,5-tetrahydropyridine-2,6-dicarboxylate N-succinyltransferase [Ignavibacteria bacterium]|nr:2,3,4,5-tetrahydropyridine-2,6-dicarboxylate N-succinyltransferase [Ignavibacteria bacterium]